MSDVEFAKEFSKRVHFGQVDKGGTPYWMHPDAVARMCSTDEEKIVAYLHDTVEDTDTTIGMITAMFGEKIGEAVSYITHPKGMPYMDQIKRLSVNEIARHVKEADLKHNMDLSRLPRVTDRDLARYDKYVVAYNYLKGIDGDAEKCVAVALK